MSSTATASYKSAAQLASIIFGSTFVAALTFAVGILLRTTSLRVARRRYLPAVECLQRMPAPQDPIDTAIIGQIKAHKACLGDRLQAIWGMDWDASKLSLGRRWGFVRRTIFYAWKQEEETGLHNDVDNVYFYLIILLVYYASQQLQYKIQDATIANVLASDVAVEQAMNMDPSNAENRLKLWMAATNERTALLDHLKTQKQSDEVMFLVKSTKPLWLTFWMQYVIILVVVGATVGVGYALLRTKPEDNARGGSGALSPTMSPTVAFVPPLPNCGIIGEQSSSLDQFDMSSDGNHLVIHFRNETDATSLGLARFYDKTETGWSLMYESSGGGASLSMDGSRVAQWVAFDTVEVYDSSGTSWVLVGEAITIDAAVFSSFSFASAGNHIAFSGDGGFVRVYEWSGSAWNQIGGDLQTSESFVCGHDFGSGISISSDGTRVAVGAPLIGKDCGGIPYVQIFQWTASGSWSPLGQTLYGNTFSDFSYYIRDNFGHTVALSADGTRVAIGAPCTDNNFLDNQSDCYGYVRVFEWNDATNEWSNLGVEIYGGGDESVDDWFGYTVSLSSDGSRLAIGAVYNDGYADNAGRVRLYDWSDGAWTPFGEANGEQVGDVLGWNVVLSGDGSVATIEALDRIQSYVLDNQACL